MFRRYGELVDDFMAMDAQTVKVDIYGVRPASASNALRARAKKDGGFYSSLIGGECYLTKTERKEGQ